MRLGAVLLRAVIGPLFIGHGTQKLFGWFGGHGLEGTGGFLEALGLRPGRRHAAAAGTAEAAGGALLTLGFLTPVATTVIASTMITAIRTAHAGKGPWVSEGGYEYNLVLIAAMAALAENGPGPLSVDSAVAPSLKGTPMALLTLGAGVAGSYLATSSLVVESAPQPSVSQQPEGQADGTAAPTAASSQ